MPATRSTTSKPKPAVAGQAARRDSQTARRGTSRRELQELSDRIDRDLDRLVRDTEALAAQVLRR